MKLLEVARMDIKKVTYKDLNGVYAAIEDRLDWWEDREPESDGQVHDDWEDKYNDLQDIYDALQELDGDEHDDNEIVDEKWKRVLDDINYYQFQYKGLSRLTI